MDNVVYFSDRIGDAEPHLLKMLEIPSVLIQHSMEPKYLLFFGGSGPCIAIPKQPDVPFYHVREKLFIVYMIVCGAVAQVYLSGVQFFAMISLLVHHHKYSVL